MSDLRDAAELALTALENATSPNSWPSTKENLRKALAQSHNPLVWMNKYGHVASFKNEELGYTDSLYTIPVEYKAEIERLHREIENLRQAYHRVKDENERLSLDLGIKDNPQFGKPF